MRGSKTIALIVTILTGLSLLIGTSLVIDDRYAKAGEMRETFQQWQVQNEIAWLNQQLTYLRTVETQIRYHLMQYPHDLIAQQDLQQVQRDKVFFRDRLNQLIQGGMISP